MYFELTCSDVHCSTRFRLDANKADNSAATVAVDSLINFEAVKVSFRFLSFAPRTYLTTAFQQRGL